MCRQRRLPSLPPRAIASEGSPACVPAAHIRRTGEQLSRCVCGGRPDAACCCLRRCQQHGRHSSVQCRRRGPRAGWPWMASAPAILHCDVQDMHRDAGVHRQARWPELKSSRPHVKPAPSSLGRRPSAGLTAAQCATALPAYASSQQLFSNPVVLVGARPAW